MGLGKKKKDGAKLPPPPGLPAAPMPPPPGGMPMPPMPPMPPAKTPDAALPPPPAPAAALPPPPAPAAALPPPPAPVVAPPAPAGAPPAPAAPLPAPPAKESKDKNSDSALSAPSGLSLKISQNEGNLPPPVEALAPTAGPEKEEEEPEKGYSSLYAKKSGKPLKQVYGHIERIGTGEIGSLLERYSDRFGHELDRDIIVMRKGERDDRLAEIRDSPTVELLNAEEEEDDSILDSETLIELNSQLKSVEDELRRLKPEYQEAKSGGDRALLRELRPTLESLMAERKMIKAVIAGEAEIDDLLAMDEEEEVDEEEEEVDEEEEEIGEEEDDLFLEFVSIVDTLLGSNLPEDAIEEFTESSGFEVYRNVGSDPEGADEDMRQEFFTVVDALLGGMPEEAVSDFVESAEFETYRAIGAMYS